MTGSVRPGPLAGLRVVELAGLGPAPFACMLLADMGASVLRVHRPGVPDGPEPVDVLLRGRVSMPLDLKASGAADRLLPVVASADVLVEGFRPGVAERLGIGPEPCLDLNPRLVYARMTGWGQTGLLAARAGHDITYLALTGALAAVGEPGRKPVPPLNLVADFGGGGMFLVVGVLAALLERERSGRGQVVDAAMVDGASYLMAMCYSHLAGGWYTPERGTNLLDGGAPFYDTYACADGRYVAVGALEPKFFTTLVETLGIADRVPAQADRHRWPELRSQLAAVFGTRTRDEWAATFSGLDACVAPVLDLTEAAAAPQLADRGTIVELDGVVQPAPAPRLSRTPGAAGWTASTRVDASALLAAWGVEVPTPGPDRGRPPDRA